MASRKTPWIKKLAKWIGSSLERFAEEGFSKTKRRKKSRFKTSAVKKTKSKKSSQKSKPSKPASKKASSLKKIQLKQSPGVRSAPRTPGAGVGSKVKKPGKPSTEVKPYLPSGRQGSKEKSPGVLVGQIAFYFEKAKACAFQVKNAEIKEGAQICIQGASTDFKMKVKSIQINRIPVPSGRPGEDIGIGVTKPVAVGDKVYLVR